MSLDSVELVMAIEEEFGITIPNERGAEMLTVGNMVDFVHSASGREGVDRQQTFDKVADIVAEQLAVDRKIVEEGSLFVEDLGME